MALLTAKISLKPKFWRRIRRKTYDRRSVRLWITCRKQMLQTKLLQRQITAYRALQHWKTPRVYNLQMCLRWRGFASLKFKMKTSLPQRSSMDYPHQIDVLHEHSEALIMMCHYRGCRTKLSHYGIYKNHEPSWTSLWHCNSRQNVLKPSTNSTRQRYYSDWPMQ